MKHVLGYLTIVTVTLALVHSLALEDGEEELIEIDFEGVKRGLEQSTIFLIDVRTAQELADEGRIPKSINIPSAQLENAFVEISPQEFETRYNFDRQKPGKPVAFSCKSGRRAKAAIDKLRSLGVKLDYRWYKGSFIDWVAKGGEVEK